MTRKTVSLGMALAIGCAAPCFAKSNVIEKLRDNVPAKSAKAAASSATTYELRPQQARTYCSNATVDIVCYTGNAPPNCGGGVCLPPGPPPAGCPDAATAPKFDAVDEIIGAYTTGNPATTNAAGEAILGYFDFGPQDGQLRCNPGQTPAIFACIKTSGADEDCVGVLRYDLRGLDLSQIKGAALHIQGFQRSFWTTLSARVCRHGYTRAGIDETATYLLDDEPASQFNPAPCNADDPTAPCHDCIVTGRDFTGDGFNIFDVLPHAALDQAALESSGMTHIPFVADFFPDVTFPLSDKALAFIAAGGENGGFVDIILRMADPRGSHSEGPTSARGQPVPGHANAVNANIFVAEDEKGLFFQNPFRSGRTNLVLTSVSDPGPTYDVRE